MHLLMAPHGLLRRLSCPVLIGLSLVLVRRGAERPRRRQHHRARHQAGHGRRRPTARATASDSGTVVFSVWLGWRDQAAAGRAAGRPAESRPAPAITAGCRRSSSATCSRRTELEVRACRGWLRAQGFDLVTVPHNHLFVTASGHGGPGRARVPGQRDAVQRRRPAGARAGRRPAASPTRWPASVTAITGLDNAYSLAAAARQDAGAAAAHRHVGRPLLALLG